MARCLVFNKGSGRLWEMGVFISTAMNIGKDLSKQYIVCVYKLISELYCYRINLVLVDTAKGVKEVSDFFGVMEMTFLFSLNTQA